MKFRAYFIAAFAVVFALTTTSVPDMYAQKKSKKADTSVQETKKEKLEKEISMLDQQIKEADSKRRDALTTLNLTRRKIDARKELIADSDSSISRLTSSIEAKQEQVNAMSARRDTLMLYYNKLIASAYRNRDARKWYMYILASDNMSQALRRYSYFKNLSNNMTPQAETIKEVQEQLQVQMDSLEVLKKQAEVLRAQRVKDMNSLQAEEKSSEKLVSDLQRNKAKYQKELAAKKRQVEALNKEIQRLIAKAMSDDSSSSTSKKSGKSKTKTSAPVDYKLGGEFQANKGKLPWPVEGYVSDHYGQQYHPVFKNLALPFNEGISVSASKSAAVTVVYDGVVKNIIVMPGYNQCVLVQHGNYFTFYCKLASVKVKAGEKVKTGQVLGTLDTINGETALHFEVWQGSKTQNPESWLRPR